MNRVKCSGWIGLAVLLVAGCDRGPDIVRRQVPRPEVVAPPPPVHAGPVGEKQRLLAAMIPSGTIVWFFRMKGPEAIVTEHQPKFDAIVRSLKFADPDLPKWTLPEGWIAEEPKAELRGLREKTLRPADKADVEIAVSKLDKERGGDILLNVNRWRGQVGLPPAKEADLPDFSKKIEVDGRKGLIVDLVGHAAAGGPMGMGGPKGRPKMAKHPEIPEMPPGGGEEAKYTYTLPAGWVKGDPKKMTRERLSVTENGETAEITISVLPPRGGDPVMNINRWRGQLQLPPLEDEREIIPLLNRIKTADRQAALVDMANPKAPAPNRILGVMVPTETAMWFLKMHGPDALVGRQKSNFEAFTHSFKFEN